MHTNVRHLCELKRATYGSSIGPELYALIPHDRATQQALARPLRAPEDAPCARTSSSPCLRLMLRFRSARRSRHASPAHAAQER